MIEEVEEKTSQKEIQGNNVRSTEQQTVSEEMNQQDF